MTANDIASLLDYHYWARDRMLDAVDALDAAGFARPHGSSFSSIRDTLVHLYLVEWVWNERWHGRTPTAPLPVDHLSDAASIRAAWHAIEREVRGFIDPLTDQELTRVVEYRLFSGAPGATPIWQIVQHVVNHGSYHRGQVTTMLRQSGGKPPEGMDLIAFYLARG